MSPRLEHKPRLAIEKLMFETDRIAMWIDEALDPGVKLRHLFDCPRADRREWRRVVDALARTIDRHEQISRSDLRAELFAPREIHRVDDLVRHLVAFIPDHVAGRLPTLLEAPHVENARRRDFDRL